MILADIAAGEVDAADLLFLVAVILFAVGAVLAAVARSVQPAIIASGLCAVALALLLL